MKDDEIGNGGGDGAEVAVVEMDMRHWALEVAVGMCVRHGAFVAALVVADFDGKDGGGGGSGGSAPIF